MKCVVAINSSTTGSTGKIMFMIAKKAAENGYKYYTSSAVNRNENRIHDKTHLYIGGIIGKKVHFVLAKYTGYNGCFSRLSTFVYIQKLKAIEPSILHIHNLHNCYINIKMLFAYIKKYQIPVVWTLHDCWAFTGHCPYFDFIKCEKWKTDCFECEQLHRYPHSMIDRTYEMYQKKRNWFIGANITLVTPSTWLLDKTKESFLKGYPRFVIHNGIDLSVFKYRSNNQRVKYSISENEFVVLGVANVWDSRKGLDVLISLGKKMVGNYRFVIVGTNQNPTLSIPDNFLYIPYVKNQIELAHIYSMADVLVNPTREDNFPTVNLEALACGTGVITFKTGGSPEMLNVNCGIIVDKEDVTGLQRAIRKLQGCNFNRLECRKQAEKYSMDIAYQKYLDLYEKIMINT
jgi:glycosyltransferase involved in cell wall biosynthesis